MIIANPIYDIIFKRLMENKRIASFFIKTLTGEQIVDIAMMPQEYTYYAKVKKELEAKEDKEVQKKETEWEVLSLIRFDYVATICNTKGEKKKILIEVQKSNNTEDLLRFRTYLGEQYRRADVVEIKTGKVEKALPILAIYLLGFKLPEVPFVAIKVGRSYFDIIGQTEIKKKSQWIESLTHDGFFVQIPHIEGKPQTALEKLLSVFEQKYFVNDMGTIKEYEYPTDIEEVKMILEICKQAAADAKTRRELEEAWWADRRAESLDKELKENKKLLKKREKMLKEKDKTIEENIKTIEENKKKLSKKDKELSEKDKTISEKEKALSEKDKLIAEYERKLGIKN